MGCSGSKEVDSATLPSRPLSPARTQKPGLPSVLTHERQLSPHDAADGNNAAWNSLWPMKISKPGAGFDVWVWPRLIHKTPEGTVPGWTYLSHGLGDLQQPEVIFTLKQRRGEQNEAFPFFPIEWIRVVYEFARKGVHIEEGHMCQVVFGNPVRFILNRIEVQGDYRLWQNDTHFTMFIHAAVTASDPDLILPEGVPQPQARHMVIALKPEEAAVAMEFGPTRVISHLGATTRWFPQPFWADRDRDNCCTMADQTGSVRKIFKLARIPGVNAIWVNDDIILTLPAREDKKIMIQAAVRDLSKATMFGLDSFMSSLANAGLTWKTGQPKELRAYGCGTGGYTNLAFISFVGEQNDDTALVMEDGYTLLLRSDSLSRICNAVANGQILDLPVNEGSLTFRLRWKQDVFLNPLDGKAYQMEMNTYQPIKAARDQRDRFRSDDDNPNPNINTTRTPPKTHAELVTIILLKEPPQEIFSTTVMIAYFEEIRAVVRELVPPHPPVGVANLCQRLTFDLQVPLSPGDGLPIYVHPSAAGVDVAAIARAVMRIPIMAKVPPRTNEILFKVQLVIGLWGYDGKDLEFLS